uniref:Uncharacterized protein n=1 Tax=Anguilla anguilla TaxID=7936 RepID=A0A0E9PM10_ANGAN
MKHRTHVVAKQLQYTTTLQYNYNNFKAQESHTCE